MRSLVAVGVVVAAIAAPCAAGGGPGVWTQISSGRQQNIATDAQGRATLTIRRGRARKLTATAVAAAYRRASVTVRAR
jgi:hypothetical protein